MHRTPENAETSLSNPASGQQAPLTVLYDGACPVCRREIGLYQRAQTKAPVCFTDVSAIGQDLPSGTTRSQLLQRFHVLSPEGRLLDGAAAFVALWERLPGWRWLARAARLPGAMWFLERCYGWFLRWRPWLQRWATALKRD